MEAYAAEKVRMDENLYRENHRMLEKNDGFAQCADALVSQVERTLANGPVCKIVIPQDYGLVRVLFPLLGKIRCSLRLEPHTLLRPSLKIPYYRVVVTKPGHSLPVR